MEGISRSPAAAKSPSCHDGRSGPRPTTRNLNCGRACFQTRRIPASCVRPCVDIDILNPEAAEAAEALIRERYEERGYILVRIGLAPKRAVLFRTDEPFKKIQVILIAPNGPNGK